MTARDPEDFIARQFIEWREDPERFCREFLGWEPWNKQVEVLEAVRDCERVAVPSGHGAGKSALAGALAWWWQLTREPSKVIVTAPGGRQAQRVLGGEVRARHATLAKRFSSEELAALGLGTAPTTEGWQRDPENFILWFATSRDAAQQHATRATGWHSPNLLAIFEEAGGIPAPIRDAMDGVLTDAGSRELAIGNPSDPTGWFARMCRDSSVRVVRINCEEFPNVAQGRQVLPYGPSRKWIQRMRDKWGEQSGAYMWKVLGLFPTVATDSLIGYADVQGALERPARECPHHANDVFLGVDPARFGDDDSVLYVLCRACGRVLDVARRHGIDTVSAAGLTIATAESWRLGPGHARQIAVDGGGLGAGVVDRLREAGWRVIEECFGGSPLRAGSEQRFRNRRAELWFGTREWLRKDAALANLDTESRDRLLDQLTAVKYRHTGGGAIYLESKEELKRRIGRSPDDGDALALAVGALARTGAPGAPWPSGKPKRTTYDERDRLADPFGYAEDPARRAAFFDAYIPGSGQSIDEVFRDW